MRSVALLVLAGTLCVVGCRSATLEPVEVDKLPVAVSFTEDVQPLLDRRCTVCHSCYNAACQLKLGSYEGIDRGGSKLPVYSSSRLVHQPPTRLFVDAQTTPEWRTRGFHSVTRNTAAGGANDSIMLQLLDAKMRKPIPRGDYYAEANDLTCAANDRELAGFLDKHPGRGMPFGFPALQPKEFRILSTWLQRGAPGPTPEEQARLTSPSRVVAGEIDKWERFLNRDDAKHAMTARYLYEHLFLANLNFPAGGPREFFRLVRSVDPPGTPVASVIATVRPYDDPGVDAFYYRFRKMHSAIVDKTHMVVQLDDATLARYRELFIEPEWLEEPHRVALDDRTGANPFLIYAQIPPVSRYRFLLDHSDYMIRTFMQGPVCKGQIALNVVHDHFWVLFLDPAADLTVQHPAFLVEQAADLRLPTEQGSTENLLLTFSNRYRARYARFFRAKLDLYEEHAPEGFGIEAIWQGRRAEDAPLLTVYRHFDSASLHRGVRGGLPRTAWVIDYPHFERIYYALVAGFDVFGNVSHQVNVRRYMDYLRIEGELNFLEFLPLADRIPILQSWYLGDRAFENVNHREVRSNRPTRIGFRTDDPKRELIERVVDTHVLESTGIEFDEVNYHRAGVEVEMPDSFATDEDILNGFRALTAPGTGFIRYNNGFGANLIYVRVRAYEGEDHAFSIVINRWHDNVNSMFAEADTLDPSKDTIDFHFELIGSYPNYFFDLTGDDVPDFFDLLLNFEETPAYEAKLDRYGVNRADPAFWPLYDWFQLRHDRADPLWAGLFDLNRYYHEAVPEIVRSD